MNLQETLEFFKKQGNYSVSLFYGEDIGADDIGDPQEERRIQIVMTPVGYLGGVRKILVTNLRELETLDLNKQPKIISNPPNYDEYRENGYYVFGTEDLIKRFIENNKIE